MSEKPESEEFDDEEDDGSAVDSDDLDVDHLIADIDKRKKTVVKAGEPAWRRLERIREERQTAEQLSGFDDYEIGGGEGELKPKRNKYAGTAAKARPLLSGMRAQSKTKPDENSLPAVREQAAHCRA